MPHPVEQGSDFPELQPFRGQMGEHIEGRVAGVPKRTGKKHKVELAKEVQAGTIAVDANPPADVAA